MRTLRTFLAALLAVASLGAQAPAEPPPAAPAPASAQLVIYNLSGPTLIPGKQVVTDNGTVVASLPRLTYKRLPLAPGAHEFRFKDFPKGPRVATLQAEPGRTYYLAVAYRPERSMAFLVLGDSMVIKLVPEAEALPQLERLTAAPE